MRILYSSDPEVPVPPKTYGGVQRLVDSLLNAFRERGHTVGLVAHPDSDAKVEQFFPWPGLDSQNTLDTMRNTLSLRAAISKFKPDLLHSFSRLMYMLPQMPTALPKIMTYGRYPGARQVSLASKLSGNSLAFTGCSQHICKTGEQGGGHWHCVYNFVEIEMFDFQAEVAEDAPLVFLSRVDRIKGAHTAIAAARKAKRPLIIAGNHASSGPDARYWEEEILPHIDKDGIKYVGPVNDEQKNALLGKAAAMIVPIEWEEPFGIVFIEALACGTPVISCPRGAVPEIMQDSVHGFIVNNVAEAVEAIYKIPEIDRHTCRKRVEEAFTSRIIIDEYERLYLHMTQGQNTDL